MIVREFVFPSWQAAVPQYYCLRVTKIRIFQCSLCVCVCVCVCVCSKAVEFMQSVHAVCAYLFLRFVPTTDISHPCFAANWAFILTQVSWMIAIWTSLLQCLCSKMCIKCEDTHTSEERLFFYKKNRIDPSLSWSWDPFLCEIWGDRIFFVAKLLIFWAELRTRKCLC